MCRIDFGINTPDSSLHGLPVPCRRSGWEKVYLPAIERFCTGVVTLPVTSDCHMCFEWLLTA